MSVIWTGSFVTMFLNTEMRSCPDISSTKIKTCRLTTVIITWDNWPEPQFEGQCEVTISVWLLITQGRSKMIYAHAHTCNTFSFKHGVLFWQLQMWGSSRFFKGECVRLLNIVNNSSDSRLSPKRPKFIYKTVKESPVCRAKYTSPFYHLHFKTSTVVYEISL